MEAPPVNRLLQLLRQKPVEPLGPAPPVLSSTSSHGSSPEGLEKSDTLYATFFYARYVTLSSRQYAPF